MNRELLGGTWYFRQDDTFVGEQRAVVRAGRPHRLDAHHRSSQLERHRHHREQAHDRVVPQGLHPPRPAEEPQGALARVLEGPLRGQQLPHEAVAEREADRLLHRLLPVRGPAQQPEEGPQHADRRGLLAAQQLRPHALAPGGVQRLRHRRLVELRGHPARGLHAQDRHGRRGGRARAAAPAPRWRGRQGGGADHAPQLHEARPRRVTRDPGGRPADPLRPGDGSRARQARAQHHRDHQEAAPVGAARSRAVRHDGRGGRGRQGAQHLPAVIRREEDRRAARRRDPAERKAAQPPRGERDGGRPRRGRRALAAHARSPDEPPEEPRRHGHALAVPHAPGLHRGARPRRDHVLGRRAGLPDPEQPLGTPGACARSPPGRPR